MAFLTIRAANRFPLICACIAAAIVALAPAPLATFQAGTYTLYYGDVRRDVRVRAGTPPMVALDQIAGVFGLTFAEDKAAGGVVIGTRGDRILALPGQSFARTAGRLIALDAPVQRDRNTWIVPLDFLSKALGPAIGQPIVVRAGSRIITVGAVRVPEIGGRVERTASGARVVFTVNPFVPYRSARDGRRIMLRLDAVALDAAAITGAAPDFAAAVRFEATTAIVDLGAAAGTHRITDDRAAGTITIELAPLNAPPPAPPSPPVPPTPSATPPSSASAATPPVAPADAARAATPIAAPPPPPSLASAGRTRRTLQTVVIDPGHGGDDRGTVGIGGTVEKDLTLLLARRLKAAFETQLGVRVILTREDDSNVSIDRRTELANNQKADVFVSLHANSSVRTLARGAQIYTLGLAAYGDRIGTVATGRGAVPVLGGGTRVVDPVPWDLAQVPFTQESAALGDVLARHFSERGLPLFATPTVAGPMRILMGANMPAVLIELGFLSNGDDERLLTSAEWQAALVDAIVAGIVEARRGQ